MSGAFDLPEDRLLSPHTGWTREHWLAHAEHLLRSVRPYASPSCSRIALPGRTSRSGADSDALEGFARTFLLAAWRISADEGTGPSAEDLIAWYSSGLTAGADAAHPEAWPRIVPGRPTQPMVEAASIALALDVTRPWLWDRLDPRAQGLVADWLGGFVGNTTWPNNWMLFQTIVEEFLASIGARYEEKEILRGLDAAEDWYVGDGWYTDGSGHNFDYYIGWAMHLYPLMWTRMAVGGARSERALQLRAVYRDRLRQFLERYFDFIGADGAPVFQGRSLTYRFAAAAPIWVGEIFDCSPYDPGLSRRAASGMVRHFAERGAPDERGLLTLGWHEEFLPMTQDYSGPASPYWASKGFLGLMLPAVHRVWTAPERPLPVETGDFISVIRPAPWVLHGTKRDGVVRLLNHGADHAVKHDAPEVWHDDPHYAALAFSTATAPDVAASAWGRRVGNLLTLVAPDGRVATRGLVEPLGGRGAHDEGVWVGSRFQPGLVAEDGAALEPLAGVEVETQCFVTAGGETRVHRVTAPAGWTVRDAGYPVADGVPPGGTVLTDPAAEVATVAGLRSVISARAGWTEAGVDEAEGANPLGRHSATPWLAAVHPGGTGWYVSHVALHGPSVPEPRTG